MPVWARSRIALDVHVHVIAEELLKRKKFVVLCTNAVLLPKHIDRKFVRTARRYRTIEIQAAHHHRRRPPARQPPPGPRNDHPRQLTCALAWPDPGPAAASAGSTSDSDRQRAAQVNDVDLGLTR